MENISEARIYVGTYAKYNDGSIEGKWLDLSDYSDKEEFYEACRELHKDEEDPESEYQRIRIEPIYDADSCVFFDLDAKRQDKADAKRCYVLTSQTSSDKIPRTIAKNSYYNSPCNHAICYDYFLIIVFHFSFM